MNFFLLYLLKFWIMLLISDSEIFQVDKCNYKNYNQKRLLKFQTHVTLFCCIKNDRKSNSSNGILLSVKISKYFIFLFIVLHILLKINWIEIMNLNSEMESEAKKIFFRSFTIWHWNKIISPRQCIFEVIFISLKLLLFVHYSF